MGKNIRVRFAPSPTGGLHLGGVRTALYNYLFARKHNGSFVVRIEDTDQSRFVPGAEEYIMETLDWCGLTPDESPWRPGAVGPYRQSERKQLYVEYADKLIKQGFAYYAFDTAEELELMRERSRTTENPSAQYDAKMREQMRNSLTLSASEVEQLLNDNIPYVVRLKMPDETVSFHDLIRGDVHFEASAVDDKVLLKADKMPTYHLAVVVDDYLMQISHAFRGEEWLPSAPVHILLWRYLFGEEHMPQWAHLPLILGPEGKLSKRDGAKYGFPVFAMNWKDHRSHELTEGFREKGFLPEAFINMLAMLGWNDGTEQEIFSMDELVQKFSIDKVHKGGAKFDYEKAKWFNHEWIKKTSVETLLPLIKSVVDREKIQVEDDFLKNVIALVKDRLTLLSDFWETSFFFFTAPTTIDFSPILSKWSDEKKNFFDQYSRTLHTTESWNAASLESIFKEMAANASLKSGELQLPFRLMLVGGKFGPAVFDIATVLGRSETIKRIENGLQQL